MKRGPVSSARRRRGPIRQPETLRIGDLHIDFHAHRAVRGGKRLDLTLTSTSGACARRSRLTASPEGGAKARMAAMGSLVLANLRSFFATGRLVTPV